MLRRLPLLIAAVLALIAVGAAPAQAATDRYVALGDSYSAGNGAASSNLNLGCGRNTYAYPYLVAAQRPNTALTFAACQGAVTTDVINSQVDSLSAATTYVTITIGGNDIGFVNLVVGCTLGNCASTITSTNAQIANQLPAKLDAAYAAIRSHAPNATVVVLGYPKPFAGRTCAATPGVTLAEETGLNGLVDNLDGVIRTRAQAAGFTYGDPGSYWSGHDICAATPYTNGWVVIPATDSYHPTRAGYANGYAPLVRSIIG
ncbi:SGNH/GDSL hydrolase family protein [Cryptosporangium phraense]|uniref:SGNH/GDSL hydrolase family protein n=1 Tax=Cryptosporangium phraense TaxID=2593070 RepID=A0A545AXQ9_9ACTN|nr:SGNH/GDSL hydrolase family protein [Cryptosporangium phraense]TQS46114.1 SGNH/GDSL hydrolase family protein [Cryptosporangium phraense]